jgi:hypothetical protein
MNLCRVQRTKKGGNNSQAASILLIFFLINFVCFYLANTFFIPKSTRVSITFHNNNISFPFSKSSPSPLSFAFCFEMWHFSSSLPIYHFVSGVSVKWSTNFTVCCVWVSVWFQCVGLVEVRRVSEISLGFLHIMIWRWLNEI